ncbi:MAG: RsmE family RNA methyltransferase [Verrucomicrobiota bacterium]|nr:16S rRNA (uracil(1498)-N(3))-methyltransferase [Limisphaera sp.]MDW8380945.1 RsmE family RNA methyltransferase [Verrucomicrobiota bacterium]
MDRFYVTPHRSSDPLVSLCPRESHHALHVLRVRRGTQVELIDGVGTVLQAEVIRADRGRVELRVLMRRREPPPPYRLALIFGITKAGAFDSIVQQATELGVTEIRPVFTERSVVRLSGEDAVARRERWRWIAVDALKQSRGTWLPEVGAPEPLTSWLSRASGFELQMYGALRTGAELLPERLARFRQTHAGRPPRSAAIYVGPEGDFTQREQAALEIAGVEPVVLGRHVLRSQTAALCMACILGLEMVCPHANDALTGVDESRSGT